MKDNFTNEMYSIDDLPLNREQKEYVLEYLARKYIDVISHICGESPCAKMYDPLVIEGNTAHSYAFDFLDGGRHHKFETLEQLETWLTDEVKKEVDEFQKELE